MSPCTLRLVLGPAAAFATLSGCAGPDSDHALQPLGPSVDSPSVRLEPLARAIGDRRIVLLGENGHGVGELTRAKVRLVEWLYRELGFDVVAMESGFFECGHVWDRIDRLTPRDALLQCLRYPFQHAEILPLFELIRSRRNADRRLALAGVDLQAQGFDSDPRPAVLAEVLRKAAPDLSVRVAAIDSALFLTKSSGGQGDSVYEWVLEHGPEARAAYESAAATADGWERWAFLLAIAWLDRLVVRANAEAVGADRPARYYELRDEWMARAVAALADSIAGPRKVVVWLHNDHARYGGFRTGAHSIRSTGGFLRDWYPDDAFSIGLFMGRGRVADNGRTEHRILPPPPGGIEDMLGAGGHPASYLILLGNTVDSIRTWADSARPYLRLGLEELELVPAREFDALFYVDSVGPPEFRIPER